MESKRSIILLADGSKPDVFEELLANGSLPNIKREIVEPGCFRRAVSAFPSTTGPAHIPFLTGCLPATCNIPGIRWFDKKLYAKDGHGSSFTFGAHGRYRSYVGMETFRINSDMRKDVYTVFEILPKSYSIFNSINRGVGHRNLTRIMRIWYWYYGHLTDRWRFVDESAVNKMLSLVKRDFEFLFVVFPGIDVYSHITDPRHDYVIGQYKFLDSAVGRLAGELKALGKWDDTLLWIVSDHGLSSTHMHFCVNTFLEERGIKTFYFPLVYRRNCVAANMVSGNGMTHVYFKRRGGWGEPATLEDINDMYPGLLDELLAEPAADVIAIRGRDGRIIARTKKGEARIALDGNNISYEVNGADPFGYNFTSKNGRAGLQTHERIILNDTIGSDYPDAPYQLAHIFTSPRCGDLVISALPGYDLRLKYEDPEHKASHGSLHREHMLVPVLCNIKLPEVPMRTVDIFPTYMKLMGHNIPQNIDGISLNYL